MRRSAEAFDVCLETVRRYQAELGRMPAIGFEERTSGGLSRTGHLGAEYIADFAKCGRRSLKRWEIRMRAFELYYVDARPLPEVLQALKVKEGTFWWWTTQIKRAVGDELYRAGLFPPRRYTERYRINWKEEIESL